MEGVNLLLNSALGEKNDNDEIAAIVTKAMLEITDNDDGVTYEEFIEVKDSMRIS